MGYHLGTYVQWFKRNVFFIYDINSCFIQLFKRCCLFCTKILRFSSTESHFLTKSVFKVRLYI